MSRSTRRPYAAITGLSSAKWDKQMAHRGLRRKQNLHLKTCLDYDNLLLPHPLECPWNNTWCWGRDGSQRYIGWMGTSDKEYFRKWFQKVLRK